MKKLLTLLLALLCVGVQETMAQSGKWVDVTATYLQNPTFATNDRNGWTTDTDAQGTNVRLEAAEFWNSTYFDTYQEVTLPAGHYRLTVKAFYRNSGNTDWAGYQAYVNKTEELLAVLYAGDDHVAVKSLFSHEMSDGDPDVKWVAPEDHSEFHLFANGMESGVLAFKSSAYDNVLEFYSTGEPIRIGVKKDGGVSEDWFMYDNFVLEQWATGNVAISSISIAPEKSVLAVGDAVTLTASVMPEQADNKNIVWSSSNTDIATVSPTGVVTGTGEGTATITATAADGSGVQNTAAVYVFDNTYNWEDVTEGYISNPSFAYNSTEGWQSTGGGHDTQYECHEVYEQAFDFYMEIDNVPNGRYRLSAQAFYRTGANSDDRRNAGLEGTDVPQAYLYGNDFSTPLANIYSEAPSDYSQGAYWNYPNGSGGGGWWGQQNPVEARYPNNMQAAAYCFRQQMYQNSIEFVVTDGHMRIGIASPNYTYYGWCIFDNFTLEYYGNIVEPTDITLDHSNVALVIGENIQLTATVKPKEATFKKVVWESEDPTIATVDQNGLVSAQTTPGTTYIYATTYDGNYEAMCEVTVTVPDATADQYVINEIMTGNAEQFIDPTFNFGAWIEIYNPTSQAAPLAGFWLSDDATNLQKWHMPAEMGAVPAHGYKTIWFDNSGPKHKTQCKFNLDCDGGVIYLSDASGKLLTSQDYPEVITRMSYARTTDAGKTWMFTAEPTLEASNNTATYCDEQLERPYVDKEGQLFEGTLNISVEIPDGATLRYTTDGSVPTLTNGETSETGFFSIDGTTVFRFRLFQDGFLPSEVATRSYIYKDREYTLPIISVVTDPKMLYDNTIGCYVRGTNGIRGRGQSSPANWNQEWDRPVNFEYLVDGEDVLNQEVTFSTCGGWSRGWAPASFKLKGNKKFGTSVSNDPVVSHQKTLNYPFFKDKPYIRNRTLQNRNGGNDIESQKPGRMLDAVVQRIALTSGIDIDGQSAEPVLYFINGQVAKYNDRSYNYHDGYMNLNMREPNNKHYVYANYGWDDEEIDIWEMDVDSGYVQMCGDRVAFEKLYELSADAADPVIYEQIRGLLDIEEFQNYMAVYLYSGSTDWPHNNTKAFRNRNDGRFRFILFDMDWTFRSSSDAFNRLDGYYKTLHTFYPLYDVYDENGNKVNNWQREVEFVAIFRDLLQNDEFRRGFIDRFCIVGGSVYEPSRVERIVTDFAERKKDMLAYDGLPNSMSYAQEIINNFAKREPTMTSALQRYYYMQLSGVEAQKVKLSSSHDAGTLYINDIEVPEDYFDGHLFAPVTLRAEVPAGYKFKGWMDMNATDSAAEPLFETGEQWSYYDQGSLDQTGWQNPDYDDAGWSTGYAPFGFGSSGKPMSNATTTLDWGDDSRNKRITYYMRKEVELADDPKDGDVFRLDYQVDDGMIVWVNGKEAASFHVPSGSAYDFYTNQDNNWYVGDDPASGTFAIDASLLHKGTNVIAVEVHNCNGTSSDLWWDASLSLTKTSEATQGVIVSTGVEYEMPEGESLDLKAVFEPMTEQERAENGIAPIRINEVSAANSIYVDDYYKKQDWVELYNTTDADIDVEGMFLTDNEEKPTKWKITKGSSQATTIVPAHGFLIVWCDKVVPLRQLHANFKLAAEGGIVRIQSADGAWSDILRYPPHNGDQTAGRYPNGADSVYVMTVPTIEKSNIKNSYMTWVDQEDPVATDIAGTFISSNNGLRIFFTGTQIALRSEETTSADVAIYTLAGQRVFQTGLRFESGSATLGLSPLMPGQTYVARAIDNEGNQCSVKFLYR